MNRGHCIFSTKIHISCLSRLSLPLVSAILSCYDCYSPSSKNYKPHAFLESISGVLPLSEQGVYTYIMSVSASTFLLWSIFPFKQELRTAHVLRKHFWCCTFRTKNIHISRLFLPTHSILRKQFWCSSTFRMKNIHTAVSTKVVPQKRKSIRDNVDWYYG